MQPERIDLSVVVIGRNEGQRLIDCLRSVQAADFGGLAHEILYVDSASTDDSPARAAALGARVLVVHPERPSAALGRNAGWRAAHGRYVLFLDGDTLLDPAFIPAALRELEGDPRHAAVSGRRRERHPERTLYNRVLDLDWISPAGESAYCGGDALFRRAALEAADGYDASLIAGEEPELCARLRAQGWRIRQIDTLMTLHDLAMTHWRQYWRRAERTGHAYAEVSQRLADSPVPLWRRETRRNRVHAAGLVAGIAAVATSAAAGFPALALAGIGLTTALMARTAWRGRWRSRDPLTLALYAVHSHVQQIPIAWGQFSWWRTARRGEARRLIEYKEEGR